MTMNIGVILTCVYLNIQRQLFCIPVPWTIVLLGLFCICFLSFPFANKDSKKFKFICAFTGLGFFIAFYIVIFGRYEYAIFAFANLIVTLLIWPIIRLLNKICKNKVANALWFYGAFTLAPYFLFWQLILMYKALTTAIQRRIYILSSFFVLSIGLLLTYQMKTIFDKANDSRNLENDMQALNRNPVNAYLIELALGAHWKYHTELCCYDGWRPPFHDPVLVISNKVLFPFEYFGFGTKLFQNHNLYENLYPDKATHFNCRCARRELLWDEPGRDGEPYN